MRTIRRAAAVLATLALPLAAAACDSGGDDDADGDGTAVDTAPTTPASTPPPPTTDPPTTPPPSTERAPTTPPSTQPETTEPPSTTIDEEALKAKIAEDLVESHRLILRLVEDPSLDRLEERVAEAVAPGEYFEILVSRVEELVILGDRLQPGDPPIQSYAVEDVVIDPTNPDAAVATVCDVSNSRQVTPGAGPIGEDVVVEGTQGLVARRYEQHVVLTDIGWRPDDFQDVMIGLWNEVESCPAP